MIYGAITNSWKLHLGSNKVKDLVGEAVDKGAKHIELRQSALGDCETGVGEDWRPATGQLKALVEAFPETNFDLAMAWPCLTQVSDPQGDAFQAALAGAKVVGRSEPHLRLVDPSPFDAPWESPQDIPDEAIAVAGLASEAARQGVVLSIENSGLPIRSMAMLVNEARARMTASDALYLGLCPDPTNQLRRYPDSDPLAELEALPLDMIKIIHFKQARDGKPHPTVDTGDLNCGRMLNILQGKNYVGPAIMEIPSDANVFENLAASFTFLQSGAK